MELEEVVPLVVTSGIISVLLNTVSVVSGSVIFSMDSRHPNRYILNKLLKNR